MSSYSLNEAQARGQQGLATARRADEQQVVGARRGDLQRAARKAMSFCRMGMTAGTVMVRSSEIGRAHV